MCIFISFSGTAREEYAIKFLSFFENHGIKVWYDQHQLFLGDDLKQTIVNDGIGGANYSIIIVNKTFLNRDWPCKEAQILYERYKRKGDIILFPILLDLTKEELKNSKVKFLLKFKYQFLHTGESIDNICYQILNRLLVDILNRNNVKSYDETCKLFKSLTLSESINIYNALSVIDSFISTNYRDKTIFLICLIKILDSNPYDKILQIISYKIYDNENISFDLFKIVESIFLISSKNFLEY